MVAVMQAVRSSSIVLPDDGLPLDPSRTFKENEIRDGFFDIVINLSEALKRLDEILSLFQLTEKKEYNLSKPLPAEDEYVYKELLIVKSQILSMITFFGPANVDRYLATIMLYYPYADRWNVKREGMNNIYTFSTQYTKLSFNDSK